jgi:spore photoproduct lyase
MVASVMRKISEKSEKIKKMEGAPLFSHMTPYEQGFLIDKAIEFNLSFQQSIKLTEVSIDLQMWGKGGVVPFWKRYEPENRENLPQVKKNILKKILIDYEKIKNDSKGYSLKQEKSNKYKKLSNLTLNSMEVKGEDKILGQCPVASEKTLCCNLITLDAVENCGFECSYCSIQSFYPHNKIYYKDSLLEKLKLLEFKKDQIYHIGTGQSSDSLFIGNQGGILDQLMTFARDNPNIILEFKTKSKNIHYFTTNEIPRNVIVTWSLNPDIIIANEEMSTASLEERLGAAKALSDKGILVGFHFHPMIYFEGFQEEYANIAKAIQGRFSPTQIAMISIGALTFTKPTIREIRKKKTFSSILKMNLVESSGKLSSPDDIKIKLFKSLYENFSNKWKEDVFFFLCMEKKEIWSEVFGKLYKNNDDFEDQLKLAYMEKIEQRT